MYYKGIVQSEEVFMTLSKVDIAQKIADDRGFKKGEADKCYISWMPSWKT